MVGAPGPCDAARVIGGPDWEELLRTGSISPDVNYFACSAGPIGGLFVSSSKSPRIIAELAESGAE